MKSLLVLALCLGVACAGKDHSRQLIGDLFSCRNLGILAHRCHVQYSLL